MLSESSQEGNHFVYHLGDEYGDLGQGEQIRIYNLHICD